MITQGASGNVAPRYFCSALTPPDADDADVFCRSASAAADIAGEILRAVQRCLPTLPSSGGAALGMYSTALRLYADVPSPQRAQAVAREAKQATGIDGEAWLAEVQRLHREGIAQQAEDTEIQYFSVANGCLCGVPNELMCEFALRAALRLNAPCFYLGGYTNGCTGYFPTEEEFDRGGYEVYWSMLDYFMYFGRVFPLRRESAAHLLEAVAAHAPIQ